MRDITLKPKTMLIVDGFGALLSAFLLGVVLTRFEDTFGMPRQTLYILALLPCVFAVYDFGTVAWVKTNRAPFLKAIAIANLAYCCLSIGFLFYHYEKLTIFGWLYFLSELAIVVGLSVVELNVATRNSLPQATSTYEK